MAKVAYVRATGKLRVFDGYSGAVKCERPNIHRQLIWRSVESEQKLLNHHLPK